MGPDELALRHVAALSSGPPIDPGLRITLNFHPDRPVGDGFVLEAIARAGAYASQFATGISNGGLTAWPGGDRWHWEHRLFGGAYDEHPGALRPVYGTLDHRRDPVGGGPRFGSAHLRLTAAAVARASFCYPDSVYAPTAFGVAERMALVELLEAEPLPEPLDDYVEAHVHGPVRPDRDAEAVVLDPSHRGTDVEAAARRLGCPVEWHPGFRVTVEELRGHPDYRGAQYVELAAALAVDGVLDPRILGSAWRTGVHDDQDLKRVWHLLARFGRQPPRP